MDCAKRRCDTEAAAAVELPEDPLVEILSRVPAKSICRFKCVSKGWRDLIADPLHRKKLPQTLEGFFFMVELHECRGESGCDEPCACIGGDGEPRGDEDSDEEELPRYGFVDLLHRSVRLVDFSYLTELPDIRNTRLIHCCNGLLLFAIKPTWHSSLSYVVCNPATKQCVAVPSSGLQQSEIFDGSAVTYLLFDPASAPCHFNLVEFAKMGYQKSVHVYSSKTQAWSHNRLDSGFYNIVQLSVYFNGMLHLMSFSTDDITVLDMEGNIQKIIPSPCQAKRMTFEYVGWSQGRLHYINYETIGDDDDDEEEEIYGDGSDHRILVWVLEDYEREQWVLKDTISFSKLLGERNCPKKKYFDYDVVGIHPDHSLVFLAQLWDQKLISYHMDTKEVCDVCTLGHGYKCIKPYVPCFSELLALENKQ